jgi:DNA polymerase-3 subunit alpha (Gram-positive type)
MDRFANELNLLVNELQVLPPKEPLKDEAEVKRIELHLHTKMSAMDSTLDVARAIKTAAAWGHPAIAIRTTGSCKLFREPIKLARRPVSKSFTVLKDI